MYVCMLVSAFVFVFVCDCVHEYVICVTLCTMYGHKRTHIPAPALCVLFLHTSVCVYVCMHILYTFVCVNVHNYVCVCACV